jgi:hypothetical protein
MGLVNASSPDSAQSSLGPTLFLSYLETAGSVRVQCPRHIAVVPLCRRHVMIGMSIEGCLIGGFGGRMAHCEASLLLTLAEGTPAADG